MGCGIAILIIVGLIIFLIIIFSGNSSNNNPPPNQTPIIQTTPICSEFKKSQAKTIDFKQLNKNPDAFKGTITKFTGQIVQIQESNGQGVIRISVTKESYGWSPSDIVFVSYIGHNEYVENDIITVYGIIQGNHTYTSQANYSITIPGLQGCVIKKQNIQKTLQESSLNIKKANITPANNTNSNTTTQQPTQPITPIVPKSWHTVTTFSGTNTKNTEPFTVKGSQWRIAWTETGDGYFGADAEKPDQSSGYCPIANTIGTNSDSTYCYTPGTYYISVNTSNTWSIKIEDYY